MEAIDPIDVISVRVGYYTTLSLEQLRQHPTAVGLFDGDLSVVDIPASRKSFEAELSVGLQTEFPEAMDIKIECLDGQPLGESSTIIGLSRADDRRMLMATRWVEAFTTLVWVRARWVAPKISGDTGALGSSISP
jgi:hypothetical protein